MDNKSPDRNALIGERVRWYRTSKKLSQEQLAEKVPLDITGSQISRYEKGDSRWPADLLIEVAIVMGLDLRLLTGTEDGQHEGKESDEWDAERYKCLLLKLPKRVRQLCYHMIKKLSELNSSKEDLNGGESSREPSTTTI